jgi:phenylalanyl-tRNA synthetase beta chain
MRTSLLPGLVEALAMNRRRQQPRVRLFELGNVFREGADEVQRIAGVACGRAVAENWASEARAVDFFDIKGDVQSLFGLTNAPASFGFVPGGEAWLHPGQAAEVRRDGAVVGWLGALHPDLLKALDIDDDVFVFEFEVDALSRRELPKAVPVSRYPSVRRDLSFELPETVAYGLVEATIRDAVGETLSEVILFDRYVGTNLGSGIKSLAIGLILQDGYRTLTDQDADRCTALAVAALESVCKAKLRG